MNTFTTFAGTTCEKCHGIGDVPSGYGRFGSGMMAWRVCPACDGTGQDADAIAALLADEARFSAEAIDADIAAWERQRDAERAALPTTLDTPF